ncbi:ATP-dependent Clp protease proteolytic subunit [Maritalea mediterranea]|uniref:ATP-dependent Clp protease proteolytic subunit n=1 Tax=Maritalea mediterranea TaxID=2909667 RepID=A0ABS9EDM6_9HYPH|nr:ATP-dependent Clp protease proteolytic subunit [Maritalea mediterranea]MCF4099989.1 ATP-dependent Clp protease proteolytic subunit [Maritalea mediterranea]
MSTETKTRFWLDDGRLMRAVFFVLLFASGVILWLDFDQLYNQQSAAPYSPQKGDTPVLPAVDRPEINPNDPKFSPIERVQLPRETLQQPLKATLEAGHILTLQGAIDVGAFARLEPELERMAEYVEWVEINSPGGSVDDALALAKLIRALELNMRVPAGGYCASSCPLIFAAGVKRDLHQQANIGVHQIYLPANDPNAARNTAQAMSDAQSITAQITKHLTDMGVDGALWVHALETPPQRLYYFTPEEAKAYKLATLISE